MNTIYRFAGLLLAGFLFAMPVLAQEEGSGGPPPQVDPPAVEEPTPPGPGDAVTSEPADAPAPESPKDKPAAELNQFAIGNQTSYQGYLEKAGVPVDGPVNFTFRLFGAASGGTALWSETQNNVGVADGVYQVALGAVSALTASLFEDPVWLEVVADGQTLAPRTQMLPSPASYVSKSLELPFIASASVGNPVISVSNTQSGTASGVFGRHNPTNSYGYLGYTNYGLFGYTSATNGVAAYGYGTNDAYGGFFYGGGANNPALYVNTPGDEAGEFRNGTVTVYEGLYREVELDPNANGAGELILARDGSTRAWLRAAESSGTGAGLYLYDGSGATGAHLAAQSTADAGRLTLYDDDGNSSAVLYGKVSSSSGGSLRLFRDPASGANGFGYVTDVTSNGATTWYYDGSGSNTIYMTAQDGSGDEGARMTLKNGSNQTTIQLDGQEGTGVGHGGQITLYDGNGNTTVEIDGEYGTDGPGRVTTEVLEITGGSDLAEYFDVAETSTVPEPGMVVSIDPSRPGQLMLASEAYDKKVAGVISGANGIAPGMMMGQAGTEAYGDTPVALTGRVYVWASAANGPIEPGDELTTSTKPGYAMLASDHTRTRGAVIGKAMTALEAGEGLVLVLL